MRAWIMATGRNTGELKRLCLRGALRAGLAAALLGAAFLPLPAIAQQLGEESPSAVILMYHRFGEDDLPNSSIQLEQFEAHLEELKSGGYTVLPLTRIVTALRNRQPLPERTVAITIDDAYRSVYEEAWPRLKAAGYPFTLFVSTDVIDGGGADYMRWTEIRELARGGVAIGNQTASHPHLPEITLDKAKDEIRYASSRIEKEIGQRPAFFAYPYGEYSLALRDAVAEAGFAAGFGQHSGVAHDRADLMQLPRFPLNENYGGIDRFRLIASALPLPVEDLTPADPVLTGANPPAVGFTVPSGVGDIGNLDCFASRQGRANIERLPPGRIEIRLTSAFPAGRSRINCTMPAPDGRWRWFGLQYYVPADR